MSTIVFIIYSYLGTSASKIKREYGISNTDILMFKGRYNY